MIIINPLPLNKIKAVIFDFDGILVDTEKNWYLADKKLLNEYNINLTWEMKKKYIGGSSYEMMKDIKNKYGIKKPVNLLVNRKNDLYLDIANNNSKMYPKMENLIKELYKKKYPLAVASGSSSLILNTILKKLNMYHFFDVIISSEDVKRSKPAPDVFLKAAKLLKVSPENILVFEDSYKGIEAAKFALMGCIGIPYIISKPLADSFYKVDILFENGMSEVNVEEIIKWIEKSDRKDNMYVNPKC